MRARLWIGVLLRFYPGAWRERYGDELRSLLEASGTVPPYRVRLDVAVSGCRERARRLGIAPRNDTRAEGVRSGASLVLCGWSLFVLAGAAVQKYSEHWQDTTPQSSRGLPGGAFDALVLTASLGSLVVLLGVCLMLPAAVARLRAGGWATVRRPILAATRLTLLALPLTVAFVVWAHRLTDAQRNGDDRAYSVAAVVWVCVLAGCLATWTIAAVKTAREVRLSPRTIRVLTALAATATAAMAAMTAATAIWWVALASSSSAFFGSAPSLAARVPPTLVVALSAMAVATVTAIRGSTRALHALGHGSELETQASAKTPTR